MSENNNRGRPTKNRQILIHDQMIGFFEMGISAPSAARKAGVNVKTAYKYYDDIINQHKEKIIRNFFQRQEREKIQIIASFDKDIEEITELLEQIRCEKKNYLDNGKPVPHDLKKDEIDAMKFRDVIKDRKAGYAIKPTPEEAYTKEQEEDGNDKT